MQQPKQRDIERYAVIYNILSNRIMLYSTRCKFDRITAKVTALCEKNIDHLNWDERRAYRDYTTVCAERYNNRWIVKRRAYGKRAKVRRYWKILNNSNDMNRRMRIHDRILELYK